MISATWKAKAGQSLELRNSTPVGATEKDYLKNNVETSEK